MIRRTIYTGCCLALGLALVLQGCSPREAGSTSAPEEAPPAETDVPEDTRSQELPAELLLPAITAHLELPVSRKLAVTRPDEDVTTVAENWYLTGTSNPDEPLLLNGGEVEGRGALGSFGVFAALEEGENVFTFTQGETEAAVTITRTATEDYATTDTITRPMPEADIAVREGAPLVLSCVAPSGGTVTATVNGQEVAMEQRAATDVEGIAATFTGEFDPVGVEGTVNLGQVTYTLTWQEETKTLESDGALIGVGKDAVLLARATGVSATVFQEESDESGYATTLKEGAVAAVEEIGAAMYKLSGAGWVFMDAVEPLTETVPDVSEITGQEYTVTDGEEKLVLHGTAPVPYIPGWTDSALELTFAGISKAEAPGLNDSKLFTGAAVSTPEGGGTKYTFTLKEPGSLWGYQVEYRENDTVISFAARPEARAGDQPLTGVDILIDAGHGGTDDGASSVALDKGPVEKDLNLATAQAVEKYLRGLGANVSMTRDDDSKLEKYDLMSVGRSGMPDLMISLHCNSISYTLDGTGPSGVEVFYYEDRAQPLAETLVNGICQRTGRTNRGAKSAYYWITLNSYAPTVMVEMGFLTNPVEYDDMRSAEGIYNTAAAIGEGVVELLGGPAR